MKTPEERDDILFAFAVEPSHNRETLDRYLRQYPDLAEDLIDLLAELRLSQSVESPATTDVVDTGLEDAWKSYLASKPQPHCATGSENPFARFKGQTFVGLATNLNVPRSILVAMRDRLVVASTIPECFVRRLSEAMPVPYDLLRAYLAGPPIIAQAVQFKSDGKPKFQGQKSFQELVQNTEMTEEQRLLLLQN